MRSVNHSIIVELWKRETPRNACSAAATPSSLSFHLGLLERAGLIRSRRESRHVIYAPDIEGTRRLLSYLTDDCCEGRPELCGGLAGAIAESEAATK
jgi:DNA-binding transcriptional ArsR family regulator